MIIVVRNVKFVFWYVDVPLRRQTVEIVSSVEQWNDDESKPEAYHLLSNRNRKSLKFGAFVCNIGKTPKTYRTEIYELQGETVRRKGL